MTTSVVFEGAGGLVYDDGTVRVLGVESEDLVTTARAEVAAGATRVELCGALGPVPLATVRGALSGSGVPVGAVMYGFESLDATVDFKNRFAAGEELREAFLLGAEPAAGLRERVDLERTAVVPTAVGDPDAAAALARELVAEGVTLIELYAGLGPEVAAAVIEAAGESVAVGLVLYPL